QIPFKFTWYPSKTLSFILFKYVTNTFFISNRSKPISSSKSSNWSSKLYILFLYIIPVVVVKYIFTKPTTSTVSPLLIASFTTCENPVIIFPVLLIEFPVLLDINSFKSSYPSLILISLLYISWQPYYFSCPSYILLYILFICLFNLFFRTTIFYNFLRHLSKTFSCFRIVDLFLIFYYFQFIHYFCR